MHIRKLSYKDKEALFDFEMKNRKWFEQFVPPRPFGYFEFNSFSKIIDSLLEEQDKKSCFLYVIYDDDRIIGRVNLSEINGETADLGYRICKSSLGMGIATKAVIELLEKAANDHHLSKLAAKTTKENLASQSVLEKCGFKFIKTIKNAATLNNRKVDFVCFERLLQEKE